MARRRPPTELEKTEWFASADLRRESEDAAPSLTVNVDKRASRDDIIAAVKANNSYRWWRLNHDYRWLRKRLKKMGLDPDQAKDLL